MRFLLDANMPRSATEVIQAAGHSATHVRDTPLANAPDDAIADYARANALVLMTRDFDFADIRAYPPSRFHGLVVLSVADICSSLAIRNLVAGFLAQNECLAQLSGRLAIVEFGRVRLRPKPA